MTQINPWMCPKALELSSTVSDVFLKALKLSSEVSECKPLSAGARCRRKRRSSRL